MFCNFIIYVFTLNWFLAFIFAGFTPSRKASHFSSLVENKLYFGGGFNENSTTEFFYLDISKPFTLTDNTSISWVDLTYTDAPRKSRTTACVGGINNNDIFIFGGLNYDNYFVKRFDTIKQKWVNITSIGDIIENNVPENRTFISCAKFSNELIAIFGGNSTAFLNDLWIYNISSSLWWKSNALNAPLPRQEYCAITLPGENILYIGGYGGNSGSRGLMSMDDLPLYYTKSNTWSSVKTYGTTPPPRKLFSAILTSDGRIIIFGGANVNDTVMFGDLWILDLATSRWSVGNILNPITDLTLSRHTANLVGNYMIIGFGEFSKSNYSSRIFMLDISQKDTYRWVTEFTPPTESANEFTSASADAAKIKLIVIHNN
ncbi:galactose oxidase [Gigaspora margarita]|uniref:Galactose oxidase n=1 Tax=Gigaspora margarita TaxID=4874 RepID=A0A8H4AUS4_GIGMA|nr:galactose oxidase [Gigaspora margarita]